MIESIKTKGKTVKRRILITLSAFLLVATAFCLYSFSSHTDKNELVLQLNMSLMTQNHFNPPAIDDDFSEKVFTAYMKQLDRYKMYFTMEDISAMAVYRTSIDDQIKDNTYALYDLSRELFDKRFDQTQGWYRKILAEPFDFNLAERYEIDADKTDWAAKDVDLETRWRQDLKYRTLMQLSNSLKQRETAADTAAIKKKTNAQFEEEARKRLLKSYDDSYAYLKKQTEDYRFAQYVNAIASCFDPHTEYQTPSENDRFELAMSGQFEGIGATLQASDGYAKVVDLTPGGPAAKQGELQVNDLIMTVKQENESEAVNIFGMLLDDAVKLIRGKKGTKVTLTVKRADGSIHTIVITRDLVIIEETYAKSALLTSKDGKIKAGYIYLPGFYVDFKHTPTGRACADDVAKEVKKLQAEGVTGIILDLRSNGGGSLQEAVNMGSIFVGSGPMVQVKYNGRLPGQLSSSGDAQYNGPLVVLVNSVSASASEILAAALQDYKRAVIIGGTQTYGKGTVQMLVDLDEQRIATIPPYNKFKPLGTLRLTIQKFFRINGGSTQLKGVTPDIVLPDVLSEFKIGERYEDNYMPWSQVMPAPYKLWKNPVNVQHLRDLSEKRTTTNIGIKTLNEQNAALKEQKEKSKISLQLGEYRKAEAEREARNKTFTSILDKKTSLSVRPLKIDISQMAGDTTKLDRNKKWLESINTDAILEEAVNVLGDIK